MKQIKDKAASVQQLLKNIGNKENKSFQSITILYMQERFLYRLSLSCYVDNFILKGGLLFFGIYSFMSRSTKDIDLSGTQLSNTFENILNVIKTIADIDCEDGIYFDTQNIGLEKIKEGQSYEGVRIKMTALLGNIRNLLQLDIGFGDVVVPSPYWLEYPALLDQEQFKIKAYSKESVS